MTPVGPQPAFGQYARLIKELGFPIIVALVLLYVVLADVPSNVMAIRQDVAAVRSELDAHSAATDAYQSALRAEVQGINDRLARIMQQICVNTATTTIDRRGCFP